MAGSTPAVRSVSDYDTTQFWKTGRTGILFSEEARM